MPTLPTSFGDALRWAAHQGHADILGVLLATSDGRRAIDETDHLGRTALLIAAERGQAAAMRTLIDHWADPNIADLVGRTPEHILRGHLIQVQPDQEEAQAELGALIAATPADNAETSTAGERVRYLINRGALPGRWQARGGTCLHEAVARGQRSIVRALLEHPDSIQTSLKQDRFDRSPLLLAVEVHATDELLDDLMFRGGAHTQLADAVAAATTLGAPARAARLQRILERDQAEERRMAIELMDV
ncbi:ankyrin repeat domain-containing protein [Dyella psychrodurans]|nr:ankyrin repeat domain-containing protein [Dyella psychrodurans]